MGKNSDKESIKKDHLKGTEEIIDILNDHLAKHGSEQSFNLLLDVFIHYFVWLNTKGRLPIHSREQMGVGIMQKAFDELNVQSAYIIPYDEEESDSKEKGKEEVRESKGKGITKSRADKKAAKGRGKGIVH